MLKAGWEKTAQDGSGLDVQGCAEVVAAAIERGECAEVVHYLGNVLAPGDAKLHVLRTELPQGLDPTVEKALDGLEKMMARLWALNRALTRTAHAQHDATEE